MITALSTRIRESVAKRFLKVVVDQARFELASTGRNRDLARRVPLHYRPIFKKQSALLIRRC